MLLSYMVGWLPDIRRTLAPVFVCVGIVVMVQAIVTLSPTTQEQRWGLFVLALVWFLVELRREQS